MNSQDFYRCLIKNETYFLYYFNTIKNDLKDPMQETYFDSFQSDLRILSSDPDCLQCITTATRCAAAADNALSYALIVSASMAVVNPVAAALYLGYAYIQHSNAQQNCSSNFNLCADVHCFNNQD